MTPAPRCVLFDLDGTLIDTYSLYMEAFRSTFEPHFKRRLSDAELLALDPYAEQRLLLNVLPETEFDEYFELFLTHYARLHEPLFEGAYDGVVDMLRALQNGGYLLGVVTGKSREAWRITATRMEEDAFDDFFDVVLTDDDVQLPKPSPEGILLALDTLEIQPGQAMYIGDSQRDCDAAQAAGLPFGVALWSHVPGRHVFPDPVNNYDLRHVFRRPSDVVTALVHAKTASTLRQAQDSGRTE